MGKNPCDLSRLKSYEYLFPTVYDNSYHFDQLHFDNTVEMLT